MRHRGYRVSLAPVTLTPYAAAQAQSFRMPSYSETAASGSPQFALSYAGQTSSATRAELGSWLSRNPAGGRRHGRAVRPRRLGARLVQQPRLHAELPRAAGRKLRGKRRGATRRPRAGDGRRRAAAAQQLVADGPLQRRVRQRGADLHRNRPGALHVVGGTARAAGRRLSVPGWPAGADCWRSRRIRCRRMIVQARRSARRKTLRCRNVRHLFIGTCRYVSTNHNAP